MLVDLGHCVSGPDGWNGWAGACLLHYHTWIAQSYADFYPLTRTLEFQHNQKIQTIEIQIIQDDLPEGPEEFYVNLTYAKLAPTFR